MRFSTARAVKREAGGAVRQNAPTCAAPATVSDRIRLQVDPDRVLKVQLASVPLRVTRGKAGSRGRQPGYRPEGEARHAQKC
ncbi:hypothetical protein Bxe_A3503 [Paraburkholderia xenovorans LB400]|uniref:Uncharacterized protein n=1 Tax=Paraburkholderia xenovorans (strain LB400) TaxID=266265 RepID=Q143K7_PARXL|nr:hypothetical protein Bxe_A3503 [Paraburkholderia xenovorans LB400]